MIELHLQSNGSEIRAALEQLDIDVEKGSKIILAKLATAAKNRVKDRMGSSLRTRTDWLRRHVYGRQRSASHYVVASPRFRSELLETGGTIVARKKRFLTFRGDDGSWHKVKSVTLPARHWFTRAEEGFEGSPEYEKAIDAGFDKAIRKFHGGAAL